MRPGDLLYIPRGQYHDALAKSGGTIHVSFGTYPVNGMDLLTETYEAALEDSAFRAPLPRFAGEGGEKAWDAHLEGLAGRLADIVRSPDFHEHMKDLQRNFRQDRGRFELPGSIANPGYRRVTNGLKIVRQDGPPGSWRATPKGSKSLREARTWSPGSWSRTGSAAGSSTRLSPRSRTGSKRNYWTPWSP